MASAPPQNALTVVEQDVEAGVVEWNLDGFPEAEFNRLLPTQTLNLPTDLLRPVVQVVKLDPSDNGGDVYHSADMPEGHYAPTKVALNKFATAAGISFVDERRTDDGTDPDVIEVTCVAEMLLPTGQRRTAVGTKRVDLNALKWRSPEHRAKYKSFHLEHVASRAQNRAIRALLSLRGSYPRQVYEKPFAVVSYAPNMSHPEVRARMLDAMTGAAAQLYGPAAARQLYPGQTINVTPAPEDDSAPETPIEIPGEKLARAHQDESTAPDWMHGLGGGAAAEPDQRSTLAERVRAHAAQGGLKGAATSPQLQKLGQLFVGAEIDASAVGEGIRRIWPDQNVNRLTANQANAVLVAGDSLGPDFGAAWRELVA